MPIALVTGASRGIGRGIAVALGGLGWRVVVNYAGNCAAADECVALVRQAGGDAVAVQGDISLAPDRERLVRESVAWGGRLDLLVNNAGIAPTVRADLLDASEESFDRLIAVNLKGPYFLTQLAARQMIAQTPDAGGSRGQVVIVSSISAYTASTNRGDYCVAKAGLGMVTRLFAARLADAGVRVYEIRPGVIATDMTGPVKAKYDALIAEGLTPIRRWGLPEDIGRAVAAVARGDLPFSTGEVLNVDGGFHLHTL
jgi:NAD(P)-dependent dehydrogenase (short-subunit alcohol dehydrogenase family)